MGEDVNCQLQNRLSESHCASASHPDHLAKFFGGLLVKKACSLDAQYAKKVVGSIYLTATQATVSCDSR